MIQKTKTRQSLRLFFRGEMLTSGRYKKITRSYANTSYDATAEGLHTAGQALGNLFNMELTDVAVLEENVLSE